MANPAPTIVFQVDLGNVNAQGHLNPDMHTESADAGRAAIIEKANHRRALIPGLNGVKTYEVHHGGTITEYGAKAIYLLNSYGPTSTNPILKVLSREDVQS